MFCENCGAKISEGMKFCENCGAKIEPIEKTPGSIEEQKKYDTPAELGNEEKRPSDKKFYEGGERVSPNIVYGSDRKYRWVYEMSLLKNPTVFLLVWKIFFFIFLGIFAIMMIADAVNWGFEDALKNLPILGYFVIGMTVVVGIGYLIYAAIMGGKYIVEFEMDEKGVNHRQIASQAKKAKKIGQATMIAGMASGNLSTIGIGMNSQRTEMYSEFARVKMVKAYPRRHVIKVNETLGHNQVYAAPEDFEFVKNFIISHCSNLKK